jgi:hypothetical protein
MTHTTTKILSLFCLILLTGSTVGAVDTESRWDTAIGFPGAFSPNGTSGYDEEINAILAADLDGLPGTEVYVGGVFTTIGQEDPPLEFHFGIARWDGTQWNRMLHGLDRYEGPFDEQQARVKDIVLFDDGSGPALYIGGDFNLAFHGDQGNGPTGNSIFVGNIVRWDGSSWSALGGGLGDFGSVNALAVINDGSGKALYAAGDIRTNVNAPFNSIARWDGTNWSAVGGEFRKADGSLGRPFSMLVYDDGSGPALYVGGAFDEAPGGVPAKNIAKWNGTVWSALGPGLGNDLLWPPDEVRTLARYDDDSGPLLYAGGSFNSSGTKQVRNIARWDGSSWSRLGNGLDSVDEPYGRRGGAEVMEVYNGELWVGGQFHQPANEPAKTCRDEKPPRNLATWNGSRWNVRLPGVYGTESVPWDLPGTFGLAAIQDDLGPSLYVGGFFDFVGCVDETTAGTQAPAGPNAISIVRSTCPGGNGGGPVCGNAVCEAGDREDCLSCPADCDGLQSGNPQNKFCCGPGTGDSFNPVSCSDARCQDGGQTCTDAPALVTCCGDGDCQGAEDVLGCPDDCTIGVPGESSIQDFAGEQINVTGRDSGSGLMEISFTPACQAIDHTIYIGDLAGVATQNWTDAACNIGVSGTASFHPGTGSVFFVVVGHDGIWEGSYGLTSEDLERNEDVGTPGCDIPQNLAGNVCM